MLPIHTVLHPTDFSERSAYAFQLAYGMARDYGARLVLLHVVKTPVVVYGDGIIPPEPEGYRRDAQERLERLPVPVANLCVERRLEEGEPAFGILHVADEIHPDLIIMGTHGRTGLSRLVMGSVAEQVLRRANCPVLTVKTPFPVEEPVLSTPEHEVVAG